MYYTHLASCPWPDGCNCGAYDLNAREREREEMHKDISLKHGRVICDILVNEPPLSDLDGNWCRDAAMADQSTGASLNEQDGNHPESTCSAWRVRKWSEYPSPFYVHKIDVVGQPMDVPELVSYANYHAYPIVDSLPSYYSPNCIEIVGVDGSKPSRAIREALAHLWVR